MNIFSKFTKLKKKSKPIVIALIMLLISGFVLSFSDFGVEAAKFSYMDDDDGSNGSSNKNKREFYIDLATAASTNGEYFTVSIEVENPGSDFTGTLRLGVDYSGYSVGYDVDISIPKGSTKTYNVNVPKSAAFAQGVVRVTVFDKYDKKVYAEKFRSIFSSQNGLLNVGLLADDPDSLTFLDNGGKKIEVNGEKNTVKLNTLDSSNVQSELNTLRILVINDYDTSTLSEETIASIRDWVKNGGILLLGTGENAERVFSGFDDFDSNFIGLDVIETLEYSFVENKDSETYQAAIFDENYDYSYMTPYSHVKYVDRGFIIVSDADLADFAENEDVGSEEVENIYIGALSMNTSSSTASYSSLTSYTVENIQGYMEKPAKTGAGILVFLIVIYVALVGPIIYLILKAMNKREKIWIAIPVLSVIFVVFIFLISLGVRVKGINLKTVTAVNVDSNTEKTFLFGYAPDPNEWSIETKEPFEYGDMVNTYSYNSDSGVDAAMKNKGDSTKLTFYPSQAFDTNCFMVYSQKKSSGDFILDLEEETYDSYSGNSGIEDGVVTNDTGVDFDYVMIITRSGSQLEEDVKDGEDVRLDLNKQLYASTYGSTMMLSDYAEKYYDKKNYDASGAVAAMTMVISDVDINSNNNEFIVVGVRKQKSLTNENEASWECYYKVY